MEAELRRVNEFRGSLDNNRRRQRGRYANIDANIDTGMNRDCHEGCKNRCEYYLFFHANSFVKVIPITAMDGLGFVSYLA